MGKPKSGGKGTKTTTATAPANGTSKNAPTQTTNAAVGGAGTGTANPKKKKGKAKDDEKKDPIAVVKGAAVERMTDLELPGLIPFQWVRRYLSEDFAKSTPLGRGGWDHDFNEWLEPDGDGFCLRNYDSVDVTFGPVPVDGRVVDRSKHLALRRSGQRFEIQELDLRTVREYASTEAGERLWLRAIVDGRGNRIVFHYHNEHLTRITDTAGREIHLRRDSHDRIVALDVQVGEHVYRPISYGYTDAGELERATDAIGRAIRYAYDGQHRLIQKWQRNGYSYRYEYDPVHGRVVRGRGDNGLQNIDLTYDFEARTTTTHGETQPRVYHWDAHGNILQEATFDGQYVVERKWDEDHLLVSQKNGAGEEYVYEYDAEGFLSKETDPAGNVRLYEREDGLLRRVVHPNGAIRENVHDGYGSLWATTLEIGARYSVDRDGYGRIVAVYGPTGVLERAEYDDRHNLLRVVGARGQVTSYEHDDFGRPTVRVDPGGRTTRLEYDLAGQTVAITHPDGTRVTYEHDGLGKVTCVHKPGGDILMGYIGTGTLRNVVTEDGGEWLFDCDGDETPTRIQNPKGETYELRYDRAGRIAFERTFDGREIHYAYDLADRVRRIDYPDESYRELEYDPLGNVVREDTPHGPITFERDSEGRILTAKLEEGPVVSTVVYERDAIGRVVAETQDGQTLRYGFDIEGRLTSRTLPTGEVTAYHYDLDGDLARVEHGGQTVHLSRDAAGSETLRHLAGAPTAIASTYDALGRLSTQEAVAPTPEGAAAVAALVHRKWQYDSCGRLQRLEDARWGATDYFYDKAHNLIRSQRREVDEAFEYDPAGGVIRALSGMMVPGERWAVRQGDIVTRTESTGYEYDARKRRTKKVRLENGRPTKDVTEYIWDCRDQLREVRLPDGEIVRYFYDAFGRRTRKVVFPVPPPEPMAPAPPPRVVRFLWEGDVLATEFDTAKEYGRAFVHEPGTFRPLLQIEQGEVFLYVLDHLGTPRELIDAKGRAAWSAAYKAWGAIVETHQGPSSGRRHPVESPFRLLGQYFDQETGLHATRFRYFDPEVARFCSPDPAGLLGGMRLVSFPGAPSVFADPYGLAMDYSGIPDTPGVYHITAPDGQYYTGSAGSGEQGLQGRLSDPDHPAASLMQQKGAKIEYFEVDLGNKTNGTKSEKDHILRNFEQQEMDDRQNVPKEGKSKNQIRAESKKKNDRNKKEVAAAKAKKGAKGAAKNT